MEFSPTSTMVFEETMESFSSFRGRSNTVQQGALHHDRRPHIKCVHFVVLSEQQVYLTQKLHAVSKKVIPLLLLGSLVPQLYYHCLIFSCFLLCSLFLINDRLPTMKYRWNTIIWWRKLSNNLGQVAILDPIFTGTESGVKVLVSWFCLISRVFSCSIPGDCSPRDSVSIFNRWNTIISWRKAVEQPGTGSNFGPDIHGNRVGCQSFGVLVLFDFSGLLLFRPRRLLSTRQCFYLQSMKHNHLMEESCRIAWDR
jgi:hypothetical protein